jgi:hypothetical protein
MKRQKSCGPHLGKLVHQLLGVVTFAYGLRFRRVIARWKGIIEEIHFGGSIMPLSIIEELDLKKPSFRPSKWPRKLKLLKIVNCKNCQKIVLSQLEKVDGHRYPSGSNHLRDLLDKLRIPLLQLWISPKIMPGPKIRTQLPLDIEGIVP